PATPARPPEAMSSLYSWPGSRRCTCRSTKPGATQQPAASITSASPSSAGAEPIAAMRPPSTRRSVISSRSLAGSSTRPPRIQILRMRPPSAFAPGPVAGRPAGEEVEHRHAHRDAVAHLVEDHARAVVGEVVRDLDAAVDRPGVHHDRVVLREAQLAAVEAEGGGVLADAREEAAG